MYPRTEYLCESWLTFLKYQQEQYASNQLFSDEIPWIINDI